MNLEELIAFSESKNIAEDVDENVLNIMGDKIVDWYDEDEDTRSDWKTRNALWLKLATQVVEKKTYPWPDSANVKFPLLTTAAMQFSARAYPALVPGPNLVTGLVIGKDETGEKKAAAERVGRHMSYQLLFEMEGWEEDMDRLCLMLPIMGCVFKKTYFDPVKNQNCSELVLPQDLVIDYYARSVDSASRISHVLYRTLNEITERIRKGLFLDIDLKTPTESSDRSETSDKINGLRPPSVTPATPYKFIECHCNWDLDGDGYDEPYIITVHYDTRKVVRIVARFTHEGIETEIDSKGKEVLTRIVPTQYFTKFGFIPNPDGSIYDLGFGLLLGGINETVNTLTNMLLDSGAINNLQSGFLGRGIRVRGGQNRFIPGEWKPVDFTGDDIKKHIFPLPTKEPSDVLFKLLETLVTSGKEMASVAEIMVGKMPGQNTPATTTMATIEQGLKVFTAIYKRIYRALGKEYEKLSRLNSIYMDEKVYFTINDPTGQISQEVYRSDYNPDNISVKPNADPNLVSSAQKLMKVQSYGALLQIGTINPQEYTKQYLEAVEADNITALMQVQPQPDPEQQKAQAELMVKSQEAQMKMQIEQMKAQMDQKSKEMELRFKAMELQMKEREMQMDMMANAAQRKMDMQGAQQKHSLDMRMNVEKHQMQKEMLKDKQAQQKQQMKEKPKSNGTQK